MSHNKFAVRAQKKTAYGKDRSAVCVPLPPREIAGYIDISSSSPYSQEHFRRSRFTNRGTKSDTPRREIAVDTRRLCIVVRSQESPFH